MRLVITESLACFLDQHPLTMEEVANRGGGALDALYRIRRERNGWLSDKTTEKLARGLGVSELALMQIAIGQPPMNAGGGIVEVPLHHTVRVYGLANALALNADVIYGDEIPENEADLDTVTVTDRRVCAAFRISGQSMEPGIIDGDVVHCIKPDSLDDIAQGKTVLCKWNDTVACKRYRRYGDTVVLESTNSAGENYEITAAEIEWLLVVVKIERDA